VPTETEPAALPAEEEGGGEAPMEAAG